MALLTAMLAFIGRQLSTVVQAILGWSVTALFGRLPSFKQTALSVALLASLLWPVAVLGLFVPSVSAWAFTMLPLQKWLGPNVVRFATLGLAAVLPIGVGGITRWISPSGKLPLWKALLAGYPLTIGYAAACLVTAVTVPVVKLGSSVRGWFDDHVFVQPRPGEYTDTLGELVRACAVAKIPVRVETVPSSMRLASTVLKAMARGTIDAVVAQEPKMLLGEGLEVYLYPADLLLRGTHSRVAHVRAAMTRTWLERYAFTVSDVGAQAMQVRLQELWQLAQSRGGAPPDEAFRRRVRNLASELNGAAVPYDEWVILDRSLHRLERVIAGAGLDLLNDDVAASDLGTGTMKDEQGHTQSVPAARIMASGEMDRKSVTVTESDSPTLLLKKAVEDVRELVRLEVSLARDEVGEQLARGKTAAIAFAATAVLSIAAFTLLVVALAFAATQSWIGSLVAGGILLAIAATAGAIGWIKLPKNPLTQTRRRLDDDVKQLKEHAA